MLSGTLGGQEGPTRSRRVSPGTRRAGGGSFAETLDAPLTELERRALAELDPADVLAWLAQADGADAARGAA